MKKVAVFYYTQSGQALDAAKSICRAMDYSDEFSVRYKEIHPLHEFPFPWTKETFFDVFPETRLGIPVSSIHEIDFTDVEDADLVLVVGQSWFLSPSLPLHSFFNDNSVKRYLYGKKVIFVNVCRNMWLMTKIKVGNYIKMAGANFVGHIVLQDKETNLISVLTIMRWLFYDKKKRSYCLPDAGVSDNDISQAQRFGEIIKSALTDDGLDGLQQNLVDSGAITYKPSVLFLEKIGYRIFGIWAQFIRRKGDFGNRDRWLRCELFMIYLLFVLYVVSPFGVSFFYLTYPLRGISRQRKEDCLNLK